MRLTTLACASALLLVRAAAAAPITPGVSQAECRQRAAGLMEVVRRWGSGGHHVEWDSGAFYRCTRPGSFQAMASHLKLEDSNNPRPLRSGAEVAFFNKLKEEIARLPPGQRIDQARLLSLALDAVAGPNGTANLQAALLTVHNVVRMLARPLTWPAEPSPADPAYPIFLDLWGRGTSVEHPGVNAFRINLHGGAQPAVTQGTMRVAITPVGLDARVVAGEVVGGNGQLVRGNRRPDQFDAWFLELQLNGMAKVRWTYVPRGSPLIAR